MEAKEFGLVNRVVEPSLVVDEAMLFGERIASKPKLTVKTGKEAYYRQLEMPLDDAYAYTSAIMVENMLQAEAEEGIGAFLEKREPRWPK
jgi:enoyl-CoA hydratase/carnithine racemase